MAKTDSSDLKLERQDFDLFSALEALDKKDYGWFSKITTEQQRKFTAYMLTTWFTNVKRDGDIGAYYLLSTEEFANRHLFNEYVQQHPELQWLMLCSASPKLGKQYREWLPSLSPKVIQLKEAVTKKQAQDYFSKVYSATDAKEISSEYTKEQNHKHRLAKLYPNMKLQDIETMSLYVSEQDIDRYEHESGNN